MSLLCGMEGDSETSESGSLTTKIGIGVLDQKLSQTRSFLCLRSLLGNNSCKQDVRLGLEIDCPLGRFWRGGAKVGGESERRGVLSFLGCDLHLGSSAGD